MTRLTGKPGSRPAAQEPAAHDASDLAAVRKEHQAGDLFVAGRPGIGDGLTGTNVESPQQVGLCGCQKSDRRIKCQRTEGNVPAVSSK